MNKKTLLTLLVGSIIGMISPTLHADNQSSYPLHPVSGADGVSRSDEDWISPYRGPGYSGDRLVDSNGLTGKVICGYQGWFRAAGDSSGTGWGHYVHGSFDDLTVEMWPDMSEYSDPEKYPVPGWTHADGRPAYLFSSANKQTVLRHFQWMEAYGIDGVAVQRFVTGLNQQQPKESFRIPGYAREAAHRTGRTFFIMYDMSGASPDRCIELMTEDWRFLVDSMQITASDRYLHQGAKPVVGLFGFFSDRFSAADANRLLDVFQTEGPYKAFVLGSGQWWWRSETATGWRDVFHRMDGYIPWNVGNYSGNNANTHYWAADQADMERAGVLYMPLVFPGFSWDNLQNQPPGTTNFPRRQGAVLWNQFVAAHQIGAKTVYVAMFDEIDEGTAIFKVTNDVPVNHYFLTLEGLPSDFYLLLTGLGTKLINGSATVPEQMPDFASQSQPPIPTIISPTDGDTMTEVSIAWSPVEHASGILGYELKLDQDIIMLSTTEYRPSLAAGEHTARVRAINGLHHRGGYSEAVVFTVPDNS